ncbi:unnamed protein product [Peniophora sp. CBMAI 1063]|nr:unnamed protein product [Peniophora sp. CBMAI 1063]
MAHTDFRLNASQNSVLTAILEEEFQPVIVEMDPLFEGGYVAVRAWVELRKAMLFDQTSFLPKDLDERHERLYRQKVDRRFRNYYGNRHRVFTQAQANPNH